MVRITHRVPIREPAPVVLDARYAAEVERSTHRAERAYAKAVQALARAEQKLQRVEQTRNRKAIRLAAEIVELRRQELVELEQMMHAAPASATHRGTRGFRPVPTTHGSVIP